MGATRAHKNRALRQEALREQLAAQGHVQHLIESIEKIDDLGEGDSFELQKLKTAAELRLKVINKYLPDLKSTELTGEGGEDIKTKTVFEMIGVQPNGDS